ncbi:MAG: pantoate--beta-alanine ligase [Chloroflexi bacterium]|nr:pantoate--beta-alanine ligase [Chloroflexota bacterium]MDA1001822.1 pantoate--beta-alanine ligase [Chloroflexota bacterium]MQC27469.1 pantoate--beta-alanine ligase [Chloroflexota bacterium]
MRIAHTIAEARAARADLPATCGFVPTMGFLHAGHRTLMDHARAECQSLAISIFVNPTQFGPGEDFERYPRDEVRDLAMCEAAGADLVFMPTVHEMYPAGATTTVTVGGITSVLEGAHRPGHFDGVATVVSKLFHIMQPDRAYFGQKDAQQLLVIRSMVRDLDMPVTIVACPTVREPDGLALSSRNVYLSPEERMQALSLSRGLRQTAAAFTEGVRNAPRLRGIVEREVAAQPLARIDYVSLADADMLAELDGEIVAPALLSMAVRFGRTRLIDNAVLTP